MKKTTYILFGTLITVFVLSFFLPAMIFKKNAFKEILLEKSGNIATVTTAPFSGIYINDELYNNCKTLTPYESLAITVIESDSITSPVIEMDENWKPNLSFKVEDDMLHVEMTMKGLIDSNPTCITYVTVDSGNENLAVIKVPRGSLQYLLPSNMKVCLKDFSEAELHINSVWEGLRFVNCSFQTLDVAY